MLKNVNKQQKTSFAAANLAGENLAAMAMNSITPEMMDSLEEGEARIFAGGYQLYRYTNDHCLVSPDEEDDFEVGDHFVFIDPNEEWDYREVFCVQTDGNEIVFTSI